MNTPNRFVPRVVARSEGEKVSAPEVLADVGGVSLSPALTAAVDTARDRLRDLERGSRAVRDLLVSETLALEAERALKVLRSLLQPAPREDVEDWLIGLSMMIPTAPKGDDLVVRIEELAVTLELPRCCYTIETRRAAARACRTDRGVFWPSFPTIEDAIAPAAQPLRTLARQLAEVIRCTRLGTAGSPKQLDPMPSQESVAADVHTYEQQPADHFRAAAVRIFRRDLERRAPDLAVLFAERLNKLAGETVLPGVTAAPAAAAAAGKPVANIAELRDASPLVQAARRDRVP